MTTDTLQARRLSIKDQLMTTHLGRDSAWCRAMRDELDRMETRIAESTDTHCELLFGLPAPAGWDLVEADAPTLAEQHAADEFAAWEAILIGTACSRTHGRDTSVYRNA